jgi:hypothetical protein
VESKNAVSNRMPGVDRHSDWGHSLTTARLKVTQTLEDRLVYLSKLPSSSFAFCSDSTPVPGTARTYIPTSHYRCVLLPSAACYYCRNPRPRPIYPTQTKQASTTSIAAALQ